MLKKVLGTLIAFGLLAGYYFYINRPPVELLDREVNCRMFTGDHLQRGRCYRNALFIYLNEPDFRDTALVAFEDLCNEGLYKACYTRDMLKKESSFNYSPFQEHMDTGNKDALKCLDANHQVDPFYRDYFCSKSRAYGMFLKDSFLASEIIQNWRLFSDKNFLIHVEHNIVFNDKYNEDLLKKNCSKTSSIDEDKYCEKFKEVDSFRKEINQILISTNPNRLSKIIDVYKSLCKKFPLSCYLLSEDTDFIYKLYKFYPADLKLQMLKDIDLSFEKKLVFWSLVKEDNLLNDIKPGHIIDKILLNYFLGNLNEISKLCSEKNIQNYEGCFLSAQTFQDAISNEKDISFYCSKGDKFSCKIITMIKKNNLLKISNDMPIYNLYFFYEDKILESYLDSPWRNVGLYLDRNRIKIITLAIFALFAIQIMILVLFKKSGNVYQFIRQQTVEKIKSRLSSNQDK